MYAQVICPATDEFPRNSEGDIALLPDGRLLLAWTRFEGGEDDDRASIAGRYSTDMGRTWSAPRLLHANDARQNCMSASLLQLPEGDLLLFFLRKNSPTDLQVCVKRSGDMGATWGKPVQVTDGNGYYVMNNARVVRLASGRLIAPVARCEDASGPAEGSGHLRASCYYSDDGGLTWQPSESWLDLSKRGAMEPGVVERSDGSLLMIIRTQFGRIYKAVSTDGGQTWDQLQITAELSPEAPASIARVPATGHLVLVWNDNFDRGMPLGGLRAPLRSAVSGDGGYHFMRYRTLEGDLSKGYAYASITFAGEEALFTYYEGEMGGRLSLKFRAVPLSWFYEMEDEHLRQSIYGRPEAAAAAAAARL